MRFAVRLGIMSLCVIAMASCTNRDAGTPAPVAVAPPAAPPAPVDGTAATSTDAAEPGRKVYDAHGCGRCHATGTELSGKGKGKGPDLSHVGAKHNAEWIARHVREPQAHNAKSRMPKYPESKIGDADLKSLSEYLAALK